MEFGDSPGQAKVTASLSRGEAFLCHASEIRRCLVSWWRRQGRGGERDLLPRPPQSVSGCNHPDFPASSRASAAHTRLGYVKQVPSSSSFSSPSHLPHFTYPPPPLPNFLHFTDPRSPPSKPRNHLPEPPLLPREAGGDYSAATASILLWPRPLIPEAGKPVGRRDFLLLTAWEQSSEVLQRGKKMVGGGRETTKNRCELCLRSALARWFVMQRSIGQSVGRAEQRGGISQTKASPHKYPPAPLSFFLS